MKFFENKILTKAVFFLWSGVEMEEISIVEIQKEL
jgi:hypothetical protein